MREKAAWVTELSLACRFNRIFTAKTRVYMLSVLSKKGCAQSLSVWQGACATTGIWKEGKNKVSCRVETHPSLGTVSQETKEQSDFYILAHEFCCLNRQQQFPRHFSLIQGLR